MEFGPIGFEALRAVVIESFIYWYMTCFSCCLLHGGLLYCLRFNPNTKTRPLETVCFQRTTRCYFSEDKNCFKFEEANNNIYITYY